MLGWSGVEWGGVERMVDEGQHWKTEWYCCSAISNHWFLMVEHCTCIVACVLCDHLYLWICFTFIDKEALTQRGAWVTGAPEVPSRVVSRRHIADIHIPYGGNIPARPFTTCKTLAMATRKCIILDILRVTQGLVKVRGTWICAQYTLI